MLVMMLQQKPGQASPVLALFIWLQMMMIMMTTDNDAYDEYDYDSGDDDVAAEAWLQKLALC